MARSPRGGAVAGILAAIAVLLIAFVIVGFSMGWIDFASDDANTTIRVDKVEMKEDTGEALKSAETVIDESIQEAGKGLQRIGEEMAPEGDNSLQDPENADVDVNVDVQENEI